MRLRPALLLGLMTGWLLGCASGQPVTSTAWLERLRPFHGAAANDVVQMDVAVVECPVGDRYVDRELWTFADEQVIALEQKAVLEDNGFRVGQVGGILPPGLEELLASERTCINPLRFELHSGGSKPLKIGPPLPVCRFELRQETQRVPATFDQAQCLLQVVASLTKDGRSRLHFTPQIQYGAPVLLPHPAADKSGWERQRPTQEYRALSWDVCVAPNQYVLVGTRYDHPGTLGHEYFLRPGEATPVQRLLVIRTSRAPPGIDSPGDDEDAHASPQSPPLALQASWTSTRGSER